MSAQVGAIKAEQEMRNGREVQNTVLSNLKSDDFRHQNVPLLRQLSNSPHRLQLAAADAVKSPVRPLLVLFPGDKEVGVTEIKAA